MGDCLFWASSGTHTAAAAALAFCAAMLTPDATAPACSSSNLSRAYAALLARFGGGWRRQVGHGNNMCEAAVTRLTAAMEDLAQPATAAAAPAALEPPQALPPPAAQQRAPERLAYTHRRPTEAPPAFMCGHWDRRQMLLALSLLVQVWLI